MRFEGDWWERAGGRGTLPGEGDVLRFVPGEEAVQVVRVEAGLATLRVLHAQHDPSRVGRETTITVEELRGMLVEGTLAEQGPVPGEVWTDRWYGAFWVRSVEFDPVRGGWAVFERISRGGAERVRLDPSTLPSDWGRRWSRVELGLQGEAPPEDGEEY